MGRTPDGPRANDGPDLSEADRILYDKAIADVEASLREEANRPFTVAVMGQTGVGKSSLVNALFDTRLATDPIRPCTTEPTEVTVTSGGHPFTFVDLPGVGESSLADAGYLNAYRQYLNTADVIIWSLHADSRSLAGDVAWLRGLINGVPPEERPAVLSRISFVLTKADLVHVDPWILPFEDSLPARVRVQPGPRTAALLTQKCRHVYETLLTPFAEHLQLSTHNESGLIVHDGPLVSDHYEVRLARPLAEPDAAALAAAHPELAAAIVRLSGSALPVACSSVLRYGLTSVMTAVVERLDAIAVRRLQAHLDVDLLDSQESEEIMSASDLMALDIRRGRQFRFAGLLADALAPVTRGGVRR